MKFERSELGTLFSKLRTAVPEVRAVGTNDAGILLSGSNAYATNLELSVRAGLSKPVEQDVVVPPRGVDFISGTVAPEISIEAEKGILTVKSGTARARLNTTPAENYPELSGPGNDARRCVVGASDLSWAISKVIYAVAKDEKHPAHRGLCFSRKGEDVLEICALDGYRMAIARINCTADGDFRFTLPAATAKAVDTISMDGSIRRNHTNRGSFLHLVQKDLGNLLGGIPAKPIHVNFRKLLKAFIQLLQFPVITPAPSSHQAHPLKGSSMIS